MRITKTIGCDNLIIANLALVIFFNESLGKDLTPLPPGYQMISLL